MLYRGFCTSNEVSVQWCTVPRRVGSREVCGAGAGPGDRERRTPAGDYFPISSAGTADARITCAAVCTPCKHGRWLKVVSDLKVQRSDNARPAPAGYIA